MTAASLGATCARTLTMRHLAVAVRGIHSAQSLAPRSHSLVAAAAAASSSSVSRHHLLDYPCRTYVSRAHPEPTPPVPIGEALSVLLANVEARRLSRAARWETTKSSRVAQRATYLARRGGLDGITDPEAIAEKVKEDVESTPYRNMDETVELAIQLNLDPRKPGQSLRGSIALPHGNGKSFRVVVFTESADVAEQALAEGAAAAGGVDLIKNILDGTVPVTGLDRALGSPDMMQHLTRTYPKIARLLGPRGLMPNPKMGTIVAEENLVEQLAKQRSGTSQYRTDKAGVVNVGVGKGSFGAEKLIDNVRSLMNEVQDSKPEQFGKGKKKGGGKKGGGGKKSGSNAKYYLKVHLSSTQEKGSVLVDLRTVDPTSSFFMSDPVA